MVINAHREKYHPLYWEMAFAVAKQSAATKKQVGALIVTSTGMISLGWNGTPAGMNNTCEHVIDRQSGKLKTNPEVIHAERNAIDKMTLQGISTRNSILFCTLSPCFECAKSMYSLGIKALYVAEYHHCTLGLDLLSCQMDIHYKDERQGYIRYDAA